MERLLHDVGTSQQNLNQITDAPCCQTLAVFSYWVVVCTSAHHFSITMRLSPLSVKFSISRSLSSVPILSISQLLYSNYSSSDNLPLALENGLDHFGFGHQPSNFSGARDSPPPVNFDGNRRGRSSWSTAPRKSGPLKNRRILIEQTTTGPA